MSGTRAFGSVDYMPLAKACAGETDNLDTCLTNGWYWIKENAQGCPVDRAPLFVVGAKGCVWQYVLDSQSCSALRRRSVDGGATWEPWEWENPPVEDGAEYRTTLRHNGKPVHARQITVENAPDNQTQTIPHGLEGIIPVKWVATATDGDNALALPYCNRFTVGVDRTEICLTTDGDYSGYTVKVTVWYCKEENE